MAYLVPARVARIRARIAAKEAVLTALDTALTEAAIPVQSHRLSSGEGSTSSEYRSIHEIRNNIRVLEGEIEHLYAMLNGYGVVNMALRRKG